MNFVQRACAVWLIGICTTPYVFCLDQQEYSADYSDESWEMKDVEGVPPYVPPPHTGANAEEYRQIADDAREKLSKIFPSHGHELTRSLFNEHMEDVIELFVQYFDDVEDALVHILYPREKKSVFGTYLSRFADVDSAIELFEELAKNTRYKALFDISPESSSDDEGGVPICHCSHALYESLMRKSRAEGLPPD
jgi:hypothetical protein